MIKESTLAFLSELGKNNNRDWFHANKNSYTIAKGNVIDYLAQVLENISKTHKEYSTIDASKCLFRINRDVRFSLNKSPYKTNIGASINTFGKKSPKAGLYIHIEPGKSFIGGGIYMPPNNVLAAVRQEIDYNFDTFKKIIAHKNFKAAYTSLDFEDTLKNPPRGYNNDNEAIVYLKLKSYVALKQCSNKEVTNSNFVKDTSETLLALIPLINFLNTGINEV